MLSRYRGRTTCPDCQGTRLRKDASYVKVGGKSITDIVLMPVKDCRDFFDQLTLSDYDLKVAKLHSRPLRTSLGSQVGKQLEQGYLRTAHSGVRGAIT